MKRNLIFSLTIFLLCLSPDALAQANLETLYRGHRFFEPRGATEKINVDPSPDILFYRGAVADKLKSRFIQAEKHFSGRWRKDGAFFRNR